MAAQGKWLSFPRQDKNYQLSYQTTRYTMGFFECCKHCKAPKRYPGCHDRCPDYLKDKEEWNKLKEAERLEAMIPHAKTDYLNKPAWHYKKY